MSGDPMAVLTSFLPLILIFAVFYFLLIMPQQKKAKEHRTMLAAIEKGDEIVTTGGIHGKIVGVADQILTLEIAEKVKIRISREAIAYKKSTNDDKKA